MHFYSISNTELHVLLFLFSFILVNCTVNFLLRCKFFFYGDHILDKSQEKGVLIFYLSVMNE